jgi:cytochrome c-type biogenesis protein CcmE
MTQEIQVAHIPSDLGTRSRGSVRMRYMVGGLLMLGFVAFLGFQIFNATTTTGAYYLTVSEINQSAAQLAGQRVRVSGAVVTGSEDWNAQEITLRFSIQDEAGQQLPIVFYGPRPDNFQRAAEAIIEGRLVDGGNFQADTLLLKCPSRYEEDPEEIYVESSR